MPTVSTTRATPLRARRNTRAAPASTPTTTARGPFDGDAPTMAALAAAERRRRAQLREMREIAARIDADAHRLQGLLDDLRRAISSASARGDVQRLLTRAAAAVADRMR